MFCQIRNISLVFTSWQLNTLNILITSLLAFFNHSVISCLLHVVTISWLWYRCQNAVIGVMYGTSWRRPALSLSASLSVLLDDRTRITIVTASRVWQFTEPDHSAMETDIQWWQNPFIHLLYQSSQLLLILIWHAYKALALLGFETVEQSLGLGFHLCDTFIFHFWPLLSIYSFTAFDPHPAFGWLEFDY